MRYAMDLYVACPPDQCALRLGEAIDSPLELSGEKKVVGIVTRGSASLRRRISYRNSFQTRLEVLITPEGEGARLSCSTESSPVSLVAAIVAALLLVQFSLTGSWPMLLASLVLMTFGGAAFVASRDAARHEGQFLVGFLQQTLNASEIPPRSLSRAPATN